MPQPDPLVNAAAQYAAEKWDDREWRQFARETGTGDIINDHPRLYRSLGFGDPDYPDVAQTVMAQVVREASDQSQGERGRAQLIAEAMPDLPVWVDADAAPRTKRLFRQYLTSLGSAIPEEWAESDEGKEEVIETTFPPGVSLGPRSLARRRLAESGAQGPPAPPGASVEPALTNPSAFSTQGAETVTDEARYRKIFIVHGHDHAALNDIRVFVHSKTNIMPVSLAEQPGQGNTIIEKFERDGGEAGFAIVLLTPDDVGQSVREQTAGSALNGRARQNVVLELGYFMGKIGRRKVVVVDAGVERPSDIDGLSYVEYPGGNWKHDLQEELFAAGFRPTP